MNSPIINHEHLEDIDSEITWAESFNIPGSLEGLNEYSSAILTLSNGLQIEVHFNDSSLYELLEEKFDVDREVQGKRTLGVFYFNSTFNEHAIGKIDTSKKIAYAEGDGFGIFKSAISGLATLWCEDGENILPIHGSAIHSKQIGGVSLIGGHRVGKTTGLLNISDLLGEGEIISDDWLLARFGGNSLGVTTTDNTVSLSQKTIQENPHISSINQPNILNDIAKRKTSYSPEKIFGPKFSNQKSQIEVDSVVLLVRGVQEAISILGDDLTNVPEFITKATYHFPYYNQGLKDAHAKKWEEGLKQAKTQIIVFDYSHFDNMTTGYSELIETIIQGRT